MVSFVSPLSTFQGAPPHACAASTLCRRWSLWHRPRRPSRVVAAVGWFHIFAYLHRQVLPMAGGRFSSWHHSFLRRNRLSRHLGVTIRCPSVRRFGPRSTVRIPPVVRPLVCSGYRASSHYRLSPSGQWHGGTVSPSAQELPASDDLGIGQELVRRLAAGSAGIRTAVKLDSQFSAAHMLYGVPLRLPGDFSLLLPIRRCIHQTL